MAANTTPPAPAGAPPADPKTPPGTGLDDRVSGLEAEQARQGGMLEQILNRLPGDKAPAPAAPGAPADPPPGKSVAELVRQGIEDLEAERASKAEGDANKQAREDHAARIKALEELAPRDTAATPAGAVRAKMQRIVFGITESSR